MNKEILTIENLEVSYPVKRPFTFFGNDRVRAVDGVNLTLNRGECLGLVGESGCGKTTTGLALTKLIAHTAGTIKYEGKDIATMARRERFDLSRRLQLIFQDPYSSLNPRSTIGDIVAAPMRVHKLATRTQRKPRVAELLARVGLKPEHASRYPHEFSGGQRQRISIARALAANPDVIIGDEPVSALDVSVQAQIINLLLDLKEEQGLSMVIISHDLGVIEHLCDRVAVMYLGRIVEQGTCYEIYSNPRHPYTQALLSSIPVPDPNASRKRIVLRGDIPSPINPPSGCHLHTRCPKAQDRCRSEAPALVDISSDHAVACHFHNTV